MLLVAPFHKDKGFTLIEVMVAVFILTIGMLALLQTVNFSILQNNSNKMRNDAILICDQSLGVKRSGPFSNITTGSTTSTPSGLGYVRQKVALGFVNYSVLERSANLTTHSLATDQIAGAKQLMLTVAWRDKGVRKTQSLTTTIMETAN